MLAMSVRWQPEVVVVSILLVIGLVVLYRMMFLNKIF